MPTPPCCCDNTPPVILLEWQARDRFWAVDHTGLKVPGDFGAWTGSFFALIGFEFGTGFFIVSQNDGTDPDFVADAVVYSAMVRVRLRHNAPNTCYLHVRAKHIRYEYFDGTFIGDLETPVEMQWDNPGSPDCLPAGLDNRDVVLPLVDLSTWVISPSDESWIVLSPELGNGGVTSIDWQVDLLPP